MQTFHVYSDESRHRNERFMLLGALLIEEGVLDEFKESFSDIRHKYGYVNDDGVHIDFLGELKWTKVSKKYLPIYKELVDLFFTLISEGQIRFCSMLIDTQDPVIQRHNNLHDDGFYKLHYQIYFHNFKVPGLYKIYPDKITNPAHRVSLDILQDYLEIGLKKKFADKVNPENVPEKYVLEITPQDSKQHNAIQMVDVVTGALGFFQNHMYEKEGAGEAKKELMEYLIDKFVYSKFLRYEGGKYFTVRSTRLNIWLFRPGK